MPFEEIHIRILVFLLVLNFACFILFGWDKYSAERQRWRVRESTLLTLAFLGGSLGSLIGQRQFRHKTQKQPFKTYLYLIAVFHIAIVFALLIPASRVAILEFVGS